MLRNYLARWTKQLQHVHRLHNVRNISTSKLQKQQFVSRGWTLVFGKYLLTTNIISSGFLLFLGDLIQQEIEFRQKKLEKRYDFARSGNSSYFERLKGQTCTIA